MDHHEGHAQAIDPHAGHKMSEAHGSHDRHAGHSVAMFRDKFWLSFALTIPVVFWSTDVQHWAWIHSAFLFRFEVNRANPRNSRLFLRWSRLHPWRMERACRPQAGHDDPYQSGDHSCVWYVSCRNIRSFRDRSLVGTRNPDYDHGPRSLAGNASHFPGPWCAQCTRRATSRYC